MRAFDILLIARGEKLESFGHAFWCLLQAFTVRVLTDALDDCTTRCCKLVGALLTGDSGWCAVFGGHECRLLVGRGAVLQTVGMISFIVLIPSGLSSRHLFGGTL